MGRQPRYLGLCEDLGLLALLQTGSEAGHDVVFSTNHLHNLLVTLYTHTLINNYSKRGQHVNIWKIKSATITTFKKRCNILQRVATIQCETGAISMCGDELKWDCLTFVYGNVKLWEQRCFSYTGPEPNTMRKVM